MKIFDPTYLEFGSPGLNLWWVGLTHQSADKRVTLLFFMKLDFIFEW